MDSIQKVKSITLWIFIVPFVAINACLILITQFHGLFHPEDIIHNTLPYIDGGASISRTARVFPTYLIFKPAMFLTSYLLIKYWIYNKNIILSLEKNNKNVSNLFICIFQYSSQHHQTIVPFRLIGYINLLLRLFVLDKEQLFYFFYRDDIQ